MPNKVPFYMPLASECAEAFSDLCGLGCTVSDAHGKAEFERGYGCESCGICRAAGRKQDECIGMQIYGMSEAERFGGKYIFFCPMGLTCFVSPILGTHEFEAKLTAGPFLMVEKQDYISCDLKDRLGIEGENLDSVIAELDHIPCISASKVNKMSTLLYMAAGFISNVSAAVKMSYNKDSEEIQGQITAYIQQLKMSEEPVPYPFDTERKMLDAVRMADKKEANKYLNILFGHILFSSGGDIMRCKSRIYELLVLINRVAIDAGADPEKTLEANHGYLSDIYEIKNFDSLCLWLTKITGKLTDSIFDFSGDRYSGAVHQCVIYMRTHYSENITLESFARKVYFSPAYFGRIFKKRTGVTFNTYLNRVRIEKSKELLSYSKLKLSEIALAVGYEDQSYFCNVFKKFEGITPVSYRKESLRVLPVSENSGENVINEKSD